MKADSEARGATILCKYYALYPDFCDLTCQTDATHIFDGLNNFPTHVAHMRFGSFVTLPTPWTPNTDLGISLDTPTLYKLALQWLKEDRDYRRELEKNGQQVVRGARRNPVRHISLSG